MPDGFNQFDIPKFTQPFDIGAQERKGQEFISGLEGFLGGLETIPAAAGRIGQELMIPQQRENIQALNELIGGLQAQVRGLPAGVAGRTRESLVTEPQRQRMIQAEAQPLLESLGALVPAQQQAQAALSSAQQQLGQRLGLEQQQTQRSLLPFTIGFDLLTQQQAREFAGYTFANEQELNRLLANQQAGVALSEGEKNRMHELAVKELEFKNRLDQISAQGEQARLTKKAPQDLSSLFSSIFG